MAVVTGLALTAASIGAGIYAQHKAGKQQEKAGNQAIDYAREQETQRRKEFDIQQQYQKHADEVAMAQWQDSQAKAKFMWDEQQRQLAPYRAARGAVLGRYGIAAAPAPREMPEGFGGVGPMPSMSAQGAAPMGPPPASGGGGGGFGALAAEPLAAGGPAVAQWLKSRKGPETYGTPSPGSVPGAGGVGYAPMSPFLPGEPGGPAGPPAFAPVFENLDAYQQYGVPGQDYQGE